MADKKVLADVGSERAVLAGLCQWGHDAFVDIDGIVDVNTFTVSNNQMLYKCLEHLFQNGTKKVDQPSIIAAANALNYHESITKEKKDLEVIRSLFNFPIYLENVRTHAMKILNLRVGRMAQDRHQEAYRNLSEINGTEGVDHIIGLSENPIFSLSHELNAGREENPETLGEGTREYLIELMDNPVENMGVPTPWPIFNKMIGGGIRTGVTLIGARPKCQPLSAKILTPSGWITYAEVKEGDIICHPDGGTTTVKHVYDTGVKEVFEFTFSDGSTTLACDEHRWKVKSRRWKKYKTLSWKEMKNTVLYESDNRPKWQFPLVDSVYFEEHSVSIPPYLMGYLIGNGCLRKATKYSCAKPHIIKKIETLLIDEYMCKKVGNSKYDYSINRGRTGKRNFYTTELRKYGLIGTNSHSKFIPHDYLLNSLENRIELLQGLFDSDGGADENGNVEYSTTSQQLSEDVEFLVKSLGGKIACKERVTKCNGKEFDSYRIRASFNDNRICFTDPDKKNRCHQRKKPDIKRMLKSVKSVGYMSTKCIKVDAKDECYITDDFIVTKNTGKSSMAKECGIHAANVLGIPVLMLDTEMKKNDQIHRAIAGISKVPLTKIETGQCGQNKKDRENVLRAEEKIRSIPFYHKRIGGKDFDEVLSIVRRWLYQCVGFDENGNTKPHLVIYDYFKLMSDKGLKDLKEYQAIGFQISSLTDFCNDYDTPVMAFVQVNRDGITKDTTDIISQSDRLLWLCTSLSIYKRKTADEIAEDGPENGNMKLVPLECRFGTPADEGDHINMQMDGAFATIKELNTQKMAVQNAQNGNTGFEVDDESNIEEQSPF